MDTFGRPKLGELEVAEELLGHLQDLDVLHNRKVALADKGSAGKETEHFATDFTGRIGSRASMTPARAAQPGRPRR
jgi:hypothetical protein